MAEPLEADSDRNHDRRGGKISPFWGQRHLSAVKRLRSYARAFSSRSRDVIVIVFLLFP
ncbi:hypothetical protein BN871_DS_00180 [Paenibacillus sp. P22]|nr:hypothetical protein BN871_DS_00180 [Paenibacillus sp. P22]